MFTSCTLFLEVCKGCLNYWFQLSSVEQCKKRLFWREVVSCVAFVPMWRPVLSFRDAMRCDAWRGAASCTVFFFVVLCLAMLCCFIWRTENCPCNDKGTVTPMGIMDRTVSLKLALPSPPSCTGSHLPWGRCRHRCGWGTGRGYQAAVQSHEKAWMRCRSGWIRRVSCVVCYAVMCFVLLCIVLCFAMFCSAVCYAVLWCGVFCLTFLCVVLYWVFRLDLYIPLILCYNSYCFTPLILYTWDHLSLSSLSLLFYVWLSKLIKPISTLSP